MWAYADETGNTGLRIFDPEQPMFMTAAMMSRSNFDMVRANDVQQLAGRLGVQALHANELGVARVEEIAADLLRLCKSADVRFFLSRVEKKFLGACKVVDTFFDQGENLAVPWHAYWIRQLRLTLTFKLSAYVLDERVCQLTMDCLTTNSEHRSKELFLAAADLMLDGRIENVPDHRSRQVITDALLWARANPENFSTHLPSKHSRHGHSPNFVAFTSLLDGLDRMSERWGRPVREIVHDQQSQFQRALADWHAIVSRPELLDAEPLRWPGEAEVHHVSKAAGSTLRIATEETSPGLQVIDAILWLFKRVSEEKAVGENSRRLMSWVFQRAHQHDFSFEGVGRRVEQAHNELMAIPQSAEQVAESKAMLVTNEEHRRRALEEYAAAKAIGKPS